MRRLGILVIAVLCLFASCGMFITNPNPLIGCYRFSESAASDAALYYLAIEENGYFIFVQAGGMNSNTAIIFEGVWEFSPSHFDFFNASGTIKLHVTSIHNAQNTAGLALSYTENNNINPFTYSWILDKASGIAEINLNTQNQYLCNITVPGYTISEQEFERATGWEIGEPEEPVEPETPGEETPGEETPGEETPGEETPDEENPDEENPDGENPDGENPDGENPDGENPEEETPPESDDQTEVGEENTEEGTV